MARRSRRGRRSYSIGKTTRRWMMGFLFIGLASAIIGLVTYVTSVIPSTDLTIGTVNISNTLFLNVISWGAGIVLVLHGLKYFGIKL